MLQLRVLGAVELTDSAGQPVDGQVLQPKRLGLLAYLLLAAPGSLHRRDDLAVLFWPELDDARARNSLSQILHQLRKTLGNDVVVVRGASEVGIDPEKLWCDALAVDQALKHGDPERALELYRGDLLKGFHVAASNEFEQWLDGERERLRARTAAAGWKLADANKEDAQQALVWARRAFALTRAPDETALRRCLQAYHAAGDFGGGMREYERFERALADEFDASPTAESRALYDSLRAEFGPAQRKPRRRFRISDPQATEAPTVRRRSRGFAVIAVFLLIGMAALGIWLAVPRARTHAQPLAAVFPFNFRGPSSDAYLGEGLARLLTSGISSSETMRVVDPHTIASAMKGDLNVLTPGRIHEFANQFDADVVVTGDVVEVNRRLRINVYLDDKKATRTATHTIEGPADSAFALISTLATRIMVASTRDAAESVNVAEHTTSSAPALKHFVEAESAYRRGSYKEAVAHYRLAVAEDSNFAHAFYRLSRAAGWTGEFATATTALNRALQLRSRLPEPSRSQVLAWSHLMSGHVNDAEPLYRSILADHPAELDALEDMADLRFHWGATAGEPWEESVKLWQRVLAIDANNTDAIIHMLRITARTRDLHEFEALQAKLERLSPSADRQTEVRMLHAFVFGTDQQRSAVANELASLDRPLQADMIMMAAAVTDHPNDVVTKLLPVLFHNSSFSSREAGHVVLEASLRMASGRVRSAWATLDSASTLDPERTQEYRAVFATLPLPTTTAAVMKEIRAELAGPAPVAVRHQYYVPARLYLGGLLDVRLNELKNAERMLAQLQSFRGGNETVTKTAAWYSRLLNAELLRARGQTREALAALGEPEQVPEGRRAYIWSYAKGQERLLRAQLLAALGQPTEAIRWYATFPDASGYDVAFLPAVRFEEARLREAARDRDGAALAYLKLITMLDKPDPELAPVSTKARISFEHIGR